MTESLRLFYALWPDEATRKALSLWQANISGRRVPSKNLHITLAFLGEQPASIVPELSRILESVSSHAIRLKLDKTGYFSHHRICWTGMEQIPEHLIQLHDELVSALLEKAVSFDRYSRFTPHITLARHSGRARMASPPPIIWNANHLVLVKSHFTQSKKGNHHQYTPIAERILNDQIAPSFP